jgi:uncharacterized protein YbjT (DUF2867 family)
MNNEPIVVLGATGTTGRRVAARLRAAGHVVRTASRRGDARFDWADRATWEPALVGARALYLMAPEGQPIESDFVACAVAAGVGRIVLLSSAAIEVMGDERLMAAEATVRASGADWTIVRANWFDQNFDEGFLHPTVLAGAVTLPLGESRHPFVDAEDIAAVAAAALTEPGHAGRTHVVTGPEELTFAEAVATVARASGRSIVCRGEPDDHLAAAAEAGIDPEVARTQLAGFDALCRHPEASAAPGTVRAVTGRDPIRFATYAERAAATGAWTT